MSGAAVRERGGLLPARFLVVAAAADQERHSGHDGRHPAHQGRCDPRASEGMDRVEETIDLLRRVEDARAGTNVLGAVGRDAENDVVLCAEARDGVPLP